MKRLRTWAVLGLLAAFYGQVSGYYEGIRMGTRAEGMGEAFVGAADDANAIFYNPAGLAFVDRFQIPSCITKPYAGLDLGSIFQTYFAVAGPVPRYEKLGTFGFAWFRRGTSTSDYDMFEEQFVENELLAENIMYLSWGRQIPIDVELPSFIRLPFAGSRLKSDNVFMGANLKILYYGFGDELVTVADDPYFDDGAGAAGLGLDFGCRYIPRRLPAMALGMTFTDLVKTDIGIGTPDYVESRIKFGAAYHFEKLQLKERKLRKMRLPGFLVSDLRVAADLILSTRHMAYHHLHTGMEKWFSVREQDFALRTGVKSGLHGYTTWAFGAGYKYFLPKPVALPFSYGFQFDYAFQLPLGAGVRNTYGNHSFSLTFLQGAMIDRKPPQGGITASPAQISPDGDGKADELTMTLNASDDNAIKSWNVAIYTMTDDGRGGQGRRLIRSYRGVNEPPGHLVWDGFNEKGTETAASGDYFCELTLVDKGDNRTVADPQKFSVKMKPISFGVRALAKAFSPNGDGKEDDIGFKLNVDPRLKIGYWGLVLEKVTAKKGGKESFDEVRKYTGRERPSPMLAWDGRNKVDRIVPHGRYRYWLEVMDFKGKKMKTPEQRVSVDLKGPAVDVSVIPVVFSPDGDGRNDFTVFSVKGDDESGIASWQVEVFRKQGDTVDSLPVITFAGEANQKRVFQWNGKDDAGTLCGQGLYQCRITATDKLKNRSVSGFRDLVIGKEDEMYRVFSPNGDGAADRAEISLPSTNRAYDEALLVILDQNKAVQKKQSQTGGMTQTIWDGTGHDGKRLPDGVYSYAYRFNKGGEQVDESVTRILRIDTEPPEITLLAVPWTFSPADAENTTFSMLATDVSPVGSWQLTVRGKDGSIMKTFEGDGTPPQNLKWDGKDADGAVPERGGKYFAQLAVTDAVGNTDSSEVKELVMLGKQKIIPLDPIHFETGKAVIKTESYPVLEEAAKILKAAGDMPVAVHGHTDNVGSAKVNMKISRERAQAVVDYITKFLDVSADRFIEVKGFGDTMPIGENDTEQGRAINRRTEIKLLEQ